MIQENPRPLDGNVVRIDRAHAEMLPDTPLDVIAQVAYCRPDVRVLVQAKIATNRSSER
jgi:hypothetical protein